MRWLKWLAIGLVVVLVLAVGGAILADRLGQPPAPDARLLIAKAQRYEVRIRRDEFGVPHVLGKTDADVAFGLGYAQSEDDFATVQEVALTTRGTLAAVEGKSGAVTPSRSADGATRLLVNSHQPYTGAVAWYEAVLESGEGWHVAGGFFPGTPFMLHGHNAHLGWANTVNAPDLVDVYRLVTNPK